MITVVEAQLGNFWGSFFARPPGRNFVMVIFSTFKFCKGKFECRQKITVHMIVAAEYCRCTADTFLRPTVC